MTIPNTPAIKNWREALKNATVDPAVGIAHGELAGNAAYRLHVTRLQPGAKVKAHFHGEGGEEYLILNGEGTLYTGKIIKDAFQEHYVPSVCQFSHVPLSFPAIVDWNTPLLVKAGDTFSIAAGTVHQLHNTGSQTLDLIFGCPDSHLSNDRVVVDDYSG